MNATITVMAILVMAAAVGTVGILTSLPSAMAQQIFAPGQHGCNPGQNDFCPPPGQNPFGNPGQCQKTFTEAGFSKQFAHEFCHQ